jgi:uncharacterized protein YceH (UPF0502 family)
VIGSLPEGGGKRLADVDLNFALRRMISFVRLSADGARVIGSLVEKDLTTPDQYPLTIKSLLAACNQASNRDPVVSYDEDTVMSTLAVLKEERLVRFVLPSHGRTAVRYRHVLPEALALDQRQCALVAVLLLRGPQTIGELRSRTDRMADFDSLEEVEHELQFLSNVEEPLATRLDRKPGQKEERWICPLAASAGDSVEGAASTSSTGAGGDRGSHDPTPLSDDRFEDLRGELATLRSEIGDLRRDMEALRESLGG